MHIKAPLCMNIATTISDVGHMLQCEYRHCFVGETKSHRSLFDKSKTCQIELLEVFTPACFSVRLIKSRAEGTSQWEEHFSPDFFRQFNEELKKFYTEHFISIKNSNKLDENALYVLRDGLEFFRCRVLGTR